MNIKRYITVNLDVLKGFKVQEKNKGSNELTMKYLGGHKETGFNVFLLGLQKVLNMSFKFLFTLPDSKSKGWKTLTLFVLKIPSERFWVFEISFEYLKDYQPK